MEKVQLDDHRWEVQFSDGRSAHYEGVIVATGITWHQNLPKLPGSFSGDYIHSFDYDNTHQFKDRNVLIIGGGNSGCDIACDAARTANKAFISLRRGYYFIPKYIFGLPTDVFKQRFQFPIRSVDQQVSQFLLKNVLVGKTQNFGLQKPDHKLMESHPIINDQLLHHLGHGDICAKVDVQHCDGDLVYFKDGSYEKIDLIVAATGYKRHYPFLSEPLIQPSENREVDLYLEVFSKQHENLFFAGGIEVSSAIYGLLGLQGEAIAATIKASRIKTNGYQQFNRQKSGKQPNLNGNNQYIDSLRHQRYVDKNLYQKALVRHIKSMAI